MRRFDPALGLQVLQAFLVEAFGEFLGFGLFQQTGRFAITRLDRRHLLQQVQRLGPPALLKILHGFAVQPRQLLLPLSLGQHVERAGVPGTLVHVVRIRIAQLHEQFDGLTPPAFVVAGFGPDIQLLDRGGSLVFLRRNDLECVVRG